MSWSSTFQIPWALPSLSPSYPCRKPLSISVFHKQSQTSETKKKEVRSFTKTLDRKTSLTKRSLAMQLGAILTIAEQPAMAVTGVNNQEDFTWVLIQIAIVAVFYLLMMPPIILNWLRTRWYKRNLLEMYLQFMFVFIFFPGVMLWAPFVNVRKLPRDPSMQYPWSTPEDPLKVKNKFLKYPFANPEDYS